MKNVIILTFSLLTLVAHAEESNYVIKLNWNDKKTLEDSIAQVCDDTSYNAVELIIPGKAGKDFTIETDADIGSGKPILGCSVSKKISGTSTTYFFNANSNCEVRVFKKRISGEEPKSATYRISDAC